MKSDKLTRRQVLGASVLGLPAIPVVVETAFAQAKPAAGALPVLSPAEPAAKALGYVEDTKTVNQKANPSHKPTQYCGNCLQWAEKNRKAPLAKCNLFPGKLVKNAGWCKVWIKAPGTA
ncbi:MAG: iron permease [Gammaproteobacteria bacterium]|nr:iron permease [Gammaproteobacteria bacterium]